MSKGNKTDFSTPHYLRFVDETQLDKRMLKLDSALNMRDIGGYTNQEGKSIKWGKIYRGEELRHLSDEDFKEFENLGINHVIDFRSDDVFYFYPDRLPKGADTINLDVMKNLDMREATIWGPVTHEKVNNYMKAFYGEVIKNKAQQYANALRILADDPDAVIYNHCTNGKDRTGTFVALIMLIAGIDEEKIISEYSLTNYTIDKAYDVLRGNREPDDIERDFYGVNPDWLQVQLDYIRDNYGNVDNYLLSNSDLTKEDLDKIRENILE